MIDAAILQADVLARPDWLHLMSEHEGEHVYDCAYGCLALGASQLLIRHCTILSGAIIAQTNRIWTQGEFELIVLVCDNDEDGARGAGLDPAICLLTGSEFEKLAHPSLRALHAFN